MYVIEFTEEIDWPTCAALQRVNVISKMSVMQQRENEEHSYAVKNWIINICWPVYNFLLEDITTK
jgi:hypothetical protein